MNGTARRSEWTVVFGGVLLLAGALMLADMVLGWFFPLTRVMHTLATIGWPLVLVGLGVLLVTRGRSNNGSEGRALYRSRSDRKVGGVLGGAAEYFRVDPSLMRLVYVVATVMTGFWFGLVLYLVAMIVVPEEQFASSGQGFVPPAPPVPGGPAAAPPAPPAPPAASVG